MVVANTFKAHILALLFLFLVLGCARPVKHAYRITDIPQEVILTIAQDTISQVSLLYPSTKTTIISLTHPATDQFGMALIDGLRHRGYTVKEHTAAHTLDELLKQQKKQREQEKADRNGHHTENVKTDRINLQESDSPVPLGYLLDHTKENHSVTLIVGDFKLIRTYTMNGDEVRPTGSWMPKEEP